jgi:hypothetical protein
MLRADQARVGWNPDKKRWEVRIQVGGEVIKRPLVGAAAADEASLKSQAIDVAKDEGYTLDPANVSVERTSSHAA